MNKEDKVGLLMAYAGAIILMIMLMASAETIYSGDSYSFESEEYDYYSIIGYPNPIEGIQVYYLEGNITIDIDKYFQPDNLSEYQFVFWKSNEPTIVYVPSGGGGGGGGGGGTRIIYRDVPKYEIAEGEGEKTTEIVTETTTENIFTNKTPTWILVALIILGILVLCFFIKFILDSCGVVNVSPDLANPDMS